MNNKFTEGFSDHIDFSYTCFDRTILRGYIMGFFMEGSIIHLLRNLGFTKHSNGVLKSLSDQFNSHIKKASDKTGVTVHW